MRDEKRGRSRDAEAAREAFLSAAEEEFARAGFDGARVEEIAERAGYNKALLFRYFDDKLGLYRAVMMRHCEEVAAGQARTIGPAVPPADVPLTCEMVQRFLEVAISWAFDFYQTHPKCVRVFSWEAAEGWTMFRQVAIQRERSGWVDETQRFLRRAQDAGLLRADLDPALFVMIVIGLTQQYHLLLPRFELMFPGVDLTSPEALAHAREQIVKVMVWGAMTSPPTATEMAQTKATVSETKLEEQRAIGI